MSATVSENMLSREPKRRIRLLPYVYLAPALFVIAVVYLYPIIDLARLSHKKVITYNNVIEVGLANFRLLSKDAFFKQALVGNLKLFAAVPILVALSVFFAALLYEQMWGWRIYRALVFLPFVLAIPVIGVAWRQMLRLNGVINTALRELGLAALALNWLGDPRIAMFTLVGVIIWKELGFGIILFLARLLSASVEVYEAARIDGANWWQQLWYITVPELRGVIEFYIVLELITMLSWVFSYVYTMTGGGPANSTYIIEFYVYRKSFGFGAGAGRQFGLAAAVSVLLLCAVLVFMFILSWIQSRRHRGD